MRTLIVLGALIAGLAFAASGGADEPTVLELEPVATVTSPVFVTAPPGDPVRVFIVQQGGTIRLVKNGVLEPTPFLVVTGISTGGERGLLSMAFAPDYAATRKF